jgi:geranylgeranyl pyrophosphate synthase
MPDIAAFLSSVRASVDAELERIVPAASVPPTRLHEAVRWSLFAGGKRIRPALVLAVGNAFNAGTADLVRTAAAIELIHTYSLVHDDLPAMDDDGLRRGRATCHVQFDEATAILAGDVMQTLAFKAIASDEGLSPAVRVRVLGLIADAAGTPSGMAAGQQLDLDAEGANITVSDLETVHRQKTGALITAAAAAGAIIGGAADDELAEIEEYAQALGLLFQVTDDLLDVTQPTEVLGKTAGKDAVADKATYPALLGLDETRRLAAQLSSAATASLDRIQRDTSLLQGLVEMVASRTN